MRAQTLFSASLLLCFAAPVSAQLTITPTFDSSITSDANAASIESTINAAIAKYHADFADPIQVSIYFTEMSGGLGESQTSLYKISYSTFYNALVADGKTVNDSTALAHLPIASASGSLNPVTGSTTINIKSAIIKALAISGSFPSALSCGCDGVVSINTLITTPGSPGSSLAFNLESALEHEIDEVLGLGSDLNYVSQNLGSYYDDPLPEDLFRYTSSGVRTFAITSSIKAYFSINGTTDLDQFDNQNDGGDFGDWQSNPLPPGVLPQVQDAFSSPNSAPPLNVELTALDVIGYDLIQSFSPVLKVTKTHTGNFTQGQVGAAYTITAGNTGPNATSGTVTVTDTLPTGLTATSIAGSGWSCAFPSCTRSDALPANGSYPAITVIVNVASNSASQVTNQVTASGGGSSQASASDVTTVGGVPGAPVLASPSNGAAGVSLTPSLSWSAASGATSYDVHFGTGNPPALATNTTATGFSTVALQQATVYYWQIVARNSAGTTASAIWSFTTGSSSCVAGLGVSSTASPAAGGGFSVSVTDGNGCSWTAVSNAGWASVTSGSSGSGNGTVNFAVAANTGASRQGTLTIAGMTFTVSQSAAAIAPMGVSPAGGSAATQTFTFSFVDPAGYADLTVLDVLINDYLDGIGACYLAFAPSSASSGYLYLVDNAGDGGYASGSPMAVPSGSTVQNSQCTISGAGSSVSASGNTMTLTLAVTFAPGFAGNKVFYTAARSNTQNSGWQALGTWNVPGAATAGPGVGGVTPSRSDSAGQTYSFTFTDTNGYGDLAVVDILTNSFLDGIHACYLAYAPSSASSGYLYLVDDAGDGGYASGSPMALPSSGTLQNGQCAINAAGSSVSASGNTLTLNLAITFSTGFAGNQVFYLAARNNSGANSGWQAAGSVTVP